MLQQQPHTAMILAAGRGTRLNDITATTPKPLVEVAGQPIIFHHLDRLQHLGLQRVIINVSYLALKIVNAINTHQPQRWPGLDITFSWEEKLLETGGGIKNAAQLLGTDPIFVINSDSVWQAGDTAPFEQLTKAHNPAASDATLLLTPCNNTQGLRKHGDFELNNNSLQFPDVKTNDHLCYIGVHICNPQWIAQHPAEAFSLVEPWKNAAQQRRLHGVIYQNQWVDMGTPQGLQLAHNISNSQAQQQAAA